MSCRDFPTQPPPTSTIMEGITLVAIATVMWYRTEELDASEIVVKFAIDDDGAVVPWMWLLRLALSFTVVSVAESDRAKDDDRRKSED
ncbi:hypothetical protein L6452_19235 [Arctium lappa]|uniref:Uncharacterized protein n=1 Tax=Arctium lappa TaxID=4217 RepID=A0ACB9B9W0_ARCLA|nr:hypothetical protein L6452_19235 [Arctium lappa]